MIVPPVIPDAVNLMEVRVNGIAQPYGTVYYSVNTLPSIKCKFSAPVNRSTVPGSLTFSEEAAAVPINISYQDGDSSVVFQPAAPIKFIAKFEATIGTGLQSAKGGKLQAALSFTLVTAINSTDKFPRVSDSVLLNIVQRQTFKYFWDFGHPVSGLARERNTSGDVVTSGGSGFGIMSIVAAVSRGFITRAEGLERLRR